MGVTAEALAILGLASPRNVVNSPPIAASTLVSSGPGPANYNGFAAAYTSNELVFACVEMLATSAGEPHIIGTRHRRERPQIRAEALRLMGQGIPHWRIPRALIENSFVEEVPNHPLVQLLNNPNPFMSRGQLWGTVVMDRCLAGNAYLVKVRSAPPFDALPLELWRLRPDRVRVIPDAKKFIAGYEYRTGQGRVTFEPKDILHFKTRHPLNDYYGMPPLMPIMGRVEIDQYMREFVAAFFRNGANPGAVLSVKQKLSQETKDEIRERQRNRFGGPAGWFKWMILDNAETSFSPMTVSLGSRGLASLDLNQISESRITMAFGIPLSIVGALTGQESSSYANKRQDWQVFWDLTMAPLLSDLDDVLNLSISGDFPGIDEVVFDLSDIRALQEDVDKIQERHRKNFQVGIESWEEAREGAGLDPADTSGTVFVPANMVPTPASSLTWSAPTSVAAMLRQFTRPVQIPETASIPEVRHDCGRLVARDVEGNPELFCAKCRVSFRPRVEVLA